MYFKNPYSKKLKKIKKLIRGESHTRLVKKDLIVGKRPSKKRNSDSDLKEITIENTILTKNTNLNN